MITEVARNPHLPEDRQLIVAIVANGLNCAVPLVVREDLAQAQDFVVAALRSLVDAISMGDPAETARGVVFEVARLINMNLAPSTAHEAYVSKLPPAAPDSAEALRRELQDFLAEKGATWFAHTVLQRTKRANRVQQEVEDRCTGELLPDALILLAAIGLCAMGLSLWPVQPASDGS